MWVYQSVNHVRVRPSLYIQIFGVRRLDAAFISRGLTRRKLTQGRL